MFEPRLWPRRFGLTDAMCYRLIALTLGCIPKYGLAAGLAQWVPASSDGHHISGPTLASFGFAGVMSGDPHRGARVTDQSAGDRFDFESKDQIGQCSPEDSGDSLATVEQRRWARRVLESTAGLSSSGLESTRFRRFRCFPWLDT